MHATQMFGEAARRVGDALATVCQDRRRTWREVVGRISRLAGGLRALPLATGGRVAVLALSDDHCLEALVAVGWAGGVAVPINSRLAAEEIARTIAHAEAETLIFDAAHTAAAQSACAAVPRLTTRIWLGGEGAPAGVHATEALIAAGEPIEAASVRPDDLLAILYTGGTTGDPKGVMISHGNILATALAHRNTHGLTEHSRFLHTGSFNFVLSFAAIFSATTGMARHVFAPGIRPDRMAPFIRDEGITHAFLVPTVATMMLEHAADLRKDLVHMRRLHTGGAPRTPRLRALLAQLPANVEVAQGYGSTEGTAAVAFLAPHVNETKGDSIGRPMPHVELKIVGPGGVELPPHEVGELVYRGPGVTLGYWKNDALTREAFRDGWFHSGDLGYVDGEGYIFLVDRKQDVIVTRGENVYSLEVERLIGSHPQVAMCAVIGVPDPVRGEAIHAYVVPKEGEQVTRREIARFCREGLAPFKRPRKILVLPGNLPLSSTGKVLKHQLRDGRFPTAPS